MLDYGKCPESVILQLETIRIIERQAPALERHWAVMGA
jgi:hypothetical protein